MSLRQSFSRFRKKAKDKLLPIFDKSKRREVNIGGEGSNRSALSLQSEPAIVVGSELGDIRAGIGADNLQPGGSRSVSRSAVEIGHDQGEASGVGTSQKHLHPHSRVQTERRSGQERGGFDETRIPTPSTSRGGGSGSK